MFDNLWLNEFVKYFFNVGYDFNYESLYIWEFVKCIMCYWLEEMWVDGFCFDFLKGFM